MSNLLKTFLIFGALFFSMHLYSGYFYCKDNFCPGDNEKDWVYEYTDNDGKSFIVIDGKPVPKEQVQERLGVGPYNRDRK